MESNPRISELLVQTGAYRDLDKPVILAGGELGIYFINTEKLVQDGGEFEKFGDNAKDMIAHAIAMTRKHETFGEVIDILAKDAENLFGAASRHMWIVSGGQRRDWLFSGPVAARLGVQHLSLYKQEKGQPDRMELYHLLQGELPFQIETDIDACTLVHIVDLITEGSSVYKRDGTMETGWVPMIRSRDGQIKNLQAVVTRLQGGEQMLAEVGVNVKPYVAIDADFLAARSKFPERALEYQKDPKAWSQKYLSEHGVADLVGAFDPNGKKVGHARNFIKRYDAYLTEIGRRQELETLVQQKYGAPVAQIIGGAK